MKMKPFLVATALVAALTASSCKKEAVPSPRLTATLNLPTTCPAGDSVVIRLFEAGKSTILAERLGVNGKATDFGQVNPGNYFFAGYSKQGGSPCDFLGGFGTSYTSDNFQVVEGQSKSVSFP